MSLGLYIVDERGEPIPCDDTEAWESIVLGAPDDDDRLRRFALRNEAIVYHELLVATMVTRHGASIVAPVLPRARVVKATDGR